MMEQESGTVLTVAAQDTGLALITLLPVRSIAMSAMDRGPTQMATTVDIAMERARLTARLATVKENTTAVPAKERASIPAPIARVMDERTVTAAMEVVPAQHVVERVVLRVRGMLDLSTTTVTSMKMRRITSGTHLAVGSHYVTLTTSQASPS